MGQEECVFCRIVSGEISSEKVYEDDDVLGFRDISPKAPTHVLLIPREHVRQPEDLAGGPEIVGKLVRAALTVAKEEGIDKSGYRLVLNCGPNAGQEVPHVHLHLLGGRRMGWPPG